MAGLAQVETEFLGAIAGAVGGALGGGAKPPAGPVDQNTPTINIVNNNRNLSAPAGMFGGS